MRTAIYGAGSLGTILGAFINKAGEPVELINRNKAHVEALNAEGAKVVGTMEFTQKVTAYTPDQMSGQYDIIFLMTKQQNNKEVVQMLKDYLAPDGVLVTFQNGLPEMLIADILGEERVLGCTVAWGATMQGPGVCELTSEPDALSFSLGAISEKRSRHFAKVKELLEMMGTVDVEENFIGTRWSKLLINAAFSGMSAVLGCTFGEAAGPKESRRIVQALIKECIDVSAKGGIRIEPVQGKDIVKLLARLKASMLQDLEKGKLTEVDAINGAVSDYGRKVGCPTPMNDKVVEIIHRIEKGEMKPGTENLIYFKQ